MVTIPDYRPDVNSTWWVDISGEFDPVTGIIRWTYRTLDPETGELPTDTYAGFLPPEDGTGRGQGHVGFSVMPKADVPLGTVIYNKASIVFDTNEPIETNQVWNTIGTVSDIGLSMVDLGDPVLVGDFTTYTLTISTTGPDEAAGVIVTDTLPLNTSYVSSSASQGSCEHVDVVICELGDIRVSEPVTVEGGCRSSSFWGDHQHSLSGGHIP